MTTGVVMVGGDIAYDGDGLRAGGGQAARAAAVVDDVAGVLRLVTCDMGMFGVVAGAAGLSAAVLRSRDADVALAGRVAALHTDVRDRADRVAAEGDGLTALTTVLAGRAAP